MRPAALAILALLGARPGPAAEPAAPRLIIVQPGYPGSTRDARSFIATLCEHLDAKAALKGLAGEYHNEEKEALRAIERDRPAFGMVSLGFYLEHRQALGLTARLQSKPKDRIVVVARGGDLKGPGDLKGQPVAGGPLHEKRFLERIAFRGKADVASWDAQPTLHASRALRDLVQRKKHRAVVLTGRDLSALGELYSGKTLEKVVESDYYPPALVVAFARAGAQGAGEKEKSAKETERAPGGAGGEPAPGRPLSTEELEKVLRALSGLPGDPQGKEILEAMGAEGFEDLPRGWLEEMERSYDAYPEKK
jgi:hypothetical protein